MQDDWLSEMMEEMVSMFTAGMLDIVNEIGNMIMSILPQALPIIGTIIAVLIGIRLVEFFVLGNASAGIISAVMDCETPSDGIPPPPNTWMEDDDAWRARWIKKQNDYAFNTEWEVRRAIDETIVEEDDEGI